MPCTTFPSRVCISIGHSDADVLLKVARAEALQGERLFEFCLEDLRDTRAGTAVIGEFTRDHPEAVVLVTCRREGHAFQGSIREQLEILEQAVASGARGIDLEIESARQVPGWMQTLGPHYLRLVSFHDYDRFPSLEPIVDELNAAPADIIKIAVKAEGRDSVRMLMQAAKRCKRPNIMLALGSEGKPSRIVAPVVGRSFTYASPRSCHATADGQMDAATLRSVYALEQLDAKTRFILGRTDESHPQRVAARVNQRLRAGGLNAVYLPWSAN